MYNMEYSWKISFYMQGKYAWMDLMDELDILWLLAPGHFVGLYDFAKTSYHAT